MVRRQAKASYFRPIYHNEIGNSSLTSRRLKESNKIQQIKMYSTFWQAKFIIVPVLVNKFGVGDFWNLFRCGKKGKKTQGEFVSRFYSQTTDFQLGYWLAVKHKYGHISSLWLIGQRGVC